MNSNFCPNCGTQIMNGQSCPNCGFQPAVNQMNMNGNQQPDVAGMNMQQQFQQMNMQQQMPVADNWKNTKAITGLILGIISFFIFGFLAFFGLGLGISGLTEANQHGGKGKGVAIAAIIVGAICSGLVLLNMILSLVAGV